VIDPRLEELATASRQTIRAAFHDYRTALRAKGTGTLHIDNTESKVFAIVKAANFLVIADISADKVNRFVAQLKDEGRSPRTIGAYLQAIKGFTRWLTRHGKLSFDPLITLSKPSTETDRRIVRRYLSHEEWQWLDAVTRKRETRFGMTGIERAMLYSLAIQTGLRSGEIRSLTRGKLHLTSHPPFVMAEAGATKNKRTARQYIQPELARELQSHVGKKLRGALVFDLPHACTMADMLREDLEAARQAWLKTIEDPQERLEADDSDFLQSVDSDGERIDFHSLRHTCATWLIHAGADVKTIQSVMRHADIKLTLDRYGHLFPGSEADAVARLRSAFRTSEMLLATGTDDSSIHCYSRKASSGGAFACESGQEDAMKTARTGVGAGYEKTPSSQRKLEVLQEKMRVRAEGLEPSTQG
jgi:integrase